MHGRPYRVSSPISKGFPPHVIRGIEAFGFGAEVHMQGRCGNRGADMAEV